MSEQHTDCTMRGLATRMSPVTNDVDATARISAACEENLALELRRGSIHPVFRTA
jgi:hypothetical protein